jgi:hypothetical protein
MLRELTRITQDDDLFLTKFRWGEFGFISPLLGLYMFK